MHICLSLRSFLIVYEEAHESEAQHSESSGSRILFCSEIASLSIHFHTLSSSEYALWWLGIAAQALRDIQALYGNDMES